MLADGGIVHRNPSSRWRARRARHPRAAHDGCQPRPPKRRVAAREDSRQRGWPYEILSSPGRRAGLRPGARYAPAQPGRPRAPGSAACDHLDQLWPAGAGDCSVDGVPVTVLSPAPIGWRLGRGTADRGLACSLGGAVDGRLSGVRADCGRALSVGFDFCICRGHWDLERSGKGARQRRRGVSRLCSWTDCGGTIAMR